MGNIALQKLLAEGQGLYQAGYYAQARKIFKKIHGVAAPNPELINIIASTYFNEKNYEKAQVWFQKVLDIQPDYTRAIWNMGMCAFKAGQVEQALDLFIRCQKHLPAKAAPYIEIALARLANHQPDKMAETLTQAPLENATQLEKDKVNALQALYAYGWTQDMGCLADCLNAFADSHNAHAASPDGVWLGGYHILLSALLKYRKYHSFDNAEGLPILHLVGDSHALTAAHEVVELGGQKYVTRPHVILNAKAYHLACEENTLAKYTLQKIVGDLSSGDKVVMMVGEIDCRQQEGFLPHIIKHNAAPQKLMEEVAQGYVEHVFKAFQATGITPLFYGVPAPAARQQVNDQQWYTFLDVVAAFNKALEKQANKNSTAFLDVYGLTADKNGQSNQEWHIDDYHVSPKVLESCFKEAEL
tara:strand:- start:341 stop:1585 length:1245 start_codon:yes stop_codon:yes gene_type:complete